MREKPYKCYLIEYNCVHSNYIVNHMKSHTGEKPYKCYPFECSCAHSNYSANHIRTYTGEKLYKCKMCDCSCAKSNPAANHMRTHTAEKSCKCNKGVYSCTLPGEYVKHMRTHTGDIPYTSWTINQCLIKITLSVTWELTQKGNHPTTLTQSWMSILYDPYMCLWVTFLQWQSKFWHYVWAAHFWETNWVSIPLWETLSFHGLWFWSTVWQFRVHGLPFWVTIRVLTECPFRDKLGLTFAKLSIYGLYFLKDTFSFDKLNFQRSKVMLF